MQFIANNTKTFLVGFMAALLVCSSVLNYAFYSGTFQSSTSSYCSGFYDGAQNAILGSQPAKPVELKKGK